MQAKKFKGTGVALVTPFNKDGSIDYKGFKKLIERCIAGKVDYLVPLGTTGESVTLDASERRSVLSFVVEIVNKRVPVMLGLGGNNTMEILRAFDDYDFSGVSSILSVSPYYNRPTQLGIIGHYRVIAQESPVPVVLYNVPSRTGSTIDATTTLELAHTEKNIIGIKEASGSLERMMQIVHQRPKDFLVISGDDMLTLPMLACGADGLVSVIANAYPKECAEMVRFGMNDDFAKARKLHYKLLDITNAIFTEGNPSGIKGLLRLKNVCEEHVRMPLVPASKALMNRMAQLV
jgi:4-hydroxy-tetrahydrodipicolinate synthase